MKTQGLTRSALMFLAVASISLALSNTAVMAENVDCTIGSQQMIVIDTNGDHTPNPGASSSNDAYLAADYDQAKKTLRVWAEGGVGIYPQMTGSYREAWFYQYNSADSSFSETSGSGGVSSFNGYHDELMMRFEPSKTEGSTTFNKFEFYWLNGNQGQNHDYPKLRWNAGDKAATLTFKDNDGDGYYDTAEGEIFLNYLHPWLTSLLIDEALEYYPSENDRQYLVLREKAYVYQVNPFQQIGPFDVFIPVRDGEIIDLECGGDDLLAMTRAVSGEEGYRYYLPYFEAGGTLFTGVALNNTNPSEAAAAAVTVYSQDGTKLERSEISLPAMGQASLVAGKGLDDKGWILVESNRKLAGLCFIADSSQGYLMFDITLIPELSTLLHVPHVAQDKTWDTDIYICNPNGQEVIVTLTFRNTGGQVIATKNVAIPANGSGAYQVGELLGEGLGSVALEADPSGPGGIAAFAVYYNGENVPGGMAKSGISAVSP